MKTTDILALLNRMTNAAIYMDGALAGGTFVRFDAQDWRVLEALRLRVERAVNDR